MRKIIIGTCLFAAFTMTAKAQAPNIAITEHDPMVKAKDNMVKNNIIDPAEQSAGNDVPDWAALTQTITARYDHVTADRTVTKAKIYFYYNKDWPQFCAGIVHYTDSYELTNDYKLLNLNAGMILKNSNDQAQLKEPLKWAEAAIKGDPENQTYKATYQALKVKTGE